MAVCFLFNAFETVGLVVWLTTKQILVPQRLLGRVSSLKLIALGLMPLSYALTGSAADLVGARTTLIGAGLLGAAVTPAFLYLTWMRSVEQRVIAAAAMPAAGPRTIGGMNA
jgi:hypothetical protein